MASLTYVMKSRTSHMTRRSGPIAAAQIRVNRLKTLSTLKSRCSDFSSGRVPEWQRSQSEKCRAIFTRKKTLQLPEARHRTWTLNFRRSRKCRKMPSVNKVGSRQKSACMQKSDSNLSWASTMDGNETKRFTSEHKSRRNQELFSLQELNVDIRSGDLLLVIGDIGSGKTSFLKSILGQLQLISGQFTMSEHPPAYISGTNTGRRNLASLSSESYVHQRSAAHTHSSRLGRAGPQFHQAERRLKFAYVPQVPWLDEGTIKDHILFGEKFNKQRYDEVLRVTCLAADIRTMTTDDQTLVGLGGSRLSYGQKCRLGLARSLYARWPTAYLIDEVLEVSGSRVATNVCEKILRPHGIGGRLQKRECLIDRARSVLVLVTNSKDILSRVQYYSTLLPKSQSSRNFIQRDWFQRVRVLSLRGGAMDYLGPLDGLPDLLTMSSSLFMSCEQSSLIIEKSVVMEFQLESSDKRSATCIDIPDSTDKHVSQEKSVFAYLASVQSDSSDISKASGVPLSILYSAPTNWKSANIIKSSSSEWLMRLLELVIYVKRCGLPLVFACTALAILFQIIPIGVFGIAWKLWEDDQIQEKAFSNISIIVATVVLVAVGCQTACMMIGFRKASNASNSLSRYTKIVFFLIRACQEHQIAQEYLVACYFHQVWKQIMKSSCTPRWTLWDAAQVISNLRAVDREIPAAFGFYAIKATFFGAITIVMLSINPLLTTFCIAHCLCAGFILLVFYTLYIYASLSVVIFTPRYFLRDTFCASATAGKHPGNAASTSGMYDHCHILAAAMQNRLELLGVRREACVANSFLTSLKRQVEVKHARVAATQRAFIWIGFLGTVLMIYILLMLVFSPFYEGRSVRLLGDVTDLKANSEKWMNNVHPTHKFPSKITRRTFGSNDSTRLTWRRFLDTKDVDAQVLPENILDQKLFEMLNQIVSTGVLGPLPKGAAAEFVSLVNCIRSSPRADDSSDVLLETAKKCFLTTRDRGHAPNQDTRAKLSHLDHARSKASIWVEGLLLVNCIAVILTTFSLLPHINSISRVFNSLRQLSQLCESNPIGPQSFAAKKSIINLFDPRSSLSQVLPIIHGEIVFDHVQINASRCNSSTCVVNFHGSTITISALSLLQHECVGIVGPSGCGKTTVFNALLGEAQVKRGSIRIDGIPITNIHLEVLREMFSIIPEVPLLISGRSVRENLDPMNECVDESVIWDTLKLCGLDEVVRASSGALHSHFVVEEFARGSASNVPAGISFIKLSSGQLRLMCVCRAVLKPRKILLIEELSSSIDQRSSEIMRNVIQQVASTRTILLISNKRDLIQYCCDRVLVMNQGRLMEMGKIMHTRCLCSPSSIEKESNVLTLRSFKNSPGQRTRELEARIAQGALLKKVFDAIKEMVPEVNLECSGTGIQLQAMDSSHVSLVSLDLKDRAFDQYRCDRNRCLGLNMAAVAKVFKLCGNDDAVVIRHENDAETVSFVFEALNDDRVSDFDITLMQIDQEHLGVPESEFSACVNLPSKQFQKICADLGQFADSLAIEVSNKSVRCSTRGDLVGGNITLKPHGTSDDDKVEIAAEGSVQLLFAVRYLNFFTKATPLSSQVQLKLSSGQPLEVTFNLHDDPTIGSLKFYLAPKVDEAETQASQD